jgi:predicted secreted protein
MVILKVKNPAIPGINPNKNREIKLKRILITKSIANKVIFLVFSLKYSRKTS